MGSTARHRDHITADEIFLRLEGTQPHEAQVAIDAHLSACADCRGLFQALALGLAPGDEEEEALIARLQARRPSADLAARVLAGAAGSEERTTKARGWRAALAGLAGRASGRSWWSGWRIPAGVGAAAAAAASVAVVLSIDSGPPRPVIEERRLVLKEGEKIVPSRSTEGRSAYFPGYVPYVPLRGDEQIAPPTGPLAGMLGAELETSVVALVGDAALAGFYLYRGAFGSLDLAQRAIEVMPPSYARLNEEAVLLLARKQVQDAVYMLELVTKKAPHIAAGHFNLAVALEANREPERALEAWEGYFENARPDKEGEWYLEAKMRLERLRRATSG